jgi:plastocyanin
MRVITSGVVALATAITAGCGGSSSNTPAAAAPPAASSYVITISNMTFSPLALHAPAGATVTVVNRDGELHSVTSEATPNAFTPGSASGVAFDTGLFLGARQFTLPANAPNGAVIPYYCQNHKALMNTPNGSITIDPTAVATMTPSAGSGGGTGY